MAKIKYQFYCRNKDEAGLALDRIERGLPDVRWCSGDKPTEWWNTNITFPAWLFVWDDNDMTFREPTDYGFSESSKDPDTVKFYPAFSKTAAKKMLKKIHRDLPDVRWLNGDLPSRFVPSPVQYPIWLEVNRANELGWRDVKEVSVSDEFHTRTLECEDAQDTAPVTAPVTDDPVDHPSHYAHGSVECIDAMVETQGKHAVQHFCVCNAFKYLWRWRGKNGMEDIKKAAWYLNKAIQLEEREEK
jgi:hypothetical protein